MTSLDQHLAQMYYNIANNEGGVLVGAGSKNKGKRHCDYSVPVNRTATGKIRCAKYLPGPGPQAWYSDDDAKRAASRAKASLVAKARVKDEDKGIGKWIKFVKETRASMPPGTSYSEALQVASLRADRGDGYTRKGPKKGPKYNAIKRAPLAARAPRKRKLAAPLSATDILTEAIQNAAAAAVAQPVRTRKRRAQGSEIDLTESKRQR